MRVSKEGQKERRPFYCKTLFIVNDYLWKTWKTLCYTDSKWLYSLIKIVGYADMVANLLKIPSAVLVPYLPKPYMDTLTLGFSIWQLESSCRPSRMRTSGASLTHDDRQQKRYVLTIFPAPTHLHATNLSQQHPSTPKPCVITRTDPYATTSHNIQQPF